MLPLLAAPTSCRPAGARRPGAQPAERGAVPARWLAEGVPYPTMSGRLALFVSAGLQHRRVRRGHGVRRLGRGDTDGALWPPYRSWGRPAHGRARRRHDGAVAHPGRRLRPPVARGRRQRARRRHRHFAYHPRDLDAALQPLASLALSVPATASPPKGRGTSGSEQACSSSGHLSAGRLAQLHAPHRVAGDRRRLLDALALLRKSAHPAHRRKSRSWRSWR